MPPAQRHSFPQIYSKNTHTLHTQLSKLQSQTHVPKRTWTRCDKKTRHWQIQVFKNTCVQSQRHTVTNIQNHTNMLPKVWHPFTYRFFANKHIQLPTHTLTPTLPQSKWPWCFGLILIYQTMDSLFMDLLIFLGTALIRSWLTVLR